MKSRRQLQKSQLASCLLSTLHRAKRIIKKQKKAVEGAKEKVRKAEAERDVYKKKSKASVKEKDAKRSEKQRLTVKKDAVQSNSTVGKQQITVRNPAGKEFSLEIEPSDSVELLKVMVASREGLNPEDLQLNLPYMVLNYKEPQDSETLADPNLRKDLAIKMATRSIGITVQSRGEESLEIRVKTSGTAEDIRKEIWEARQRLLGAEERGVRIYEDDYPVLTEGEYSFFFGGEELLPNRCLYEYKLTDGATVDVDIGMKIFVETLTGKTIHLDVEYYEAFKSVKEKIHEIEGIPVDQQHLYQFGKELPDLPTSLTTASPSKWNPRTPS